MTVHGAAVRLTGSRASARKRSDSAVKPLFHPHLVNGTTGDPALYIDCLFQHRALMFDLGELTSLPPRRALRVTDVFVTHAHMDHLFGFDRLLRLLLGRDQRLRLFGPPGFVDRVAHRLQGYAWNLLEKYTAELVIEAHDVAADGAGRRAVFRSRSRFTPEDAAEPRFEAGVLVDEPDFRIRVAHLDHGIPCLGLTLEEKTHLNVWKNRVEALGLPTGPWLARLKALARQDAPDETPVEIAWRDRHGDHRLMHPLGFLRREILQEVPGQKIAYITDAAYTDANRKTIVELARNADLLYIEAPFLESASARAAATAHLTATQAGRLARAAGARRAVPFHFSPRHTGDEQRLTEEFFAAFRERTGGDAPRSVSDN